jgi:sugar phosphate isomerase/epimerase
MTPVPPYRIAVCSWSLQPENADVLAERAHATGVTGVQLALDPIRLGTMQLAETRNRLREAGLAIVSGMMGMEGEDYSTLERIRLTGGLVPNGTWAANRRAAAELARIAAELKLTLVTFHAGFIPPAATNPGRAVLLERLGAVAEIYAERGVQIALETGQESSLALGEVLGALERQQVRVNFDPANLILYGMGDPAAALAALAPRVVQMHIKDALPAVHGGEWGVEVPVGEGAVDWAALLGALRACREVNTLVIEREAGNDRVGDVTSARQFLESVLR